VQHGVGPYLEGKDGVTYCKYYQWVCFVLFFQAIFFYIPRYLWKTLEDGWMHALVTNHKVVMLDKEQKSKIISQLVEYFIDNLQTHNSYTMWYYICEILNFANVIAHLMFLNYFFKDEFELYGLNVFRFNTMDLKERGTIIQKYLLRGHTQMEVDSMHSTIERKVRNKKINIPADYVTICKTACTKEPYYIECLTFDFFQIIFLNTFFQINTFREQKGGSSSYWNKMFNVQIRQNSIL